MSNKCQFLINMSELIRCDQKTKTLYCPNHDSAANALYAEYKEICGYDDWKIKNPQILNDLPNRDNDQILTKLLETRQMRKRANDGLFSRLKHHFQCRIEIDQKHQRAIDYIKNVIETCTYMVELYVGELTNRGYYNKPSKETKETKEVKIINGYDPESLNQSKEDVTEEETEEVVEQVKEQEPMKSPKKKKSHKKKSKRKVDKNLLNKIIEKNVSESLHYEFMKKNVIDYMMKHITDTLIERNALTDINLYLNVFLLSNIDIAITIHGVVDITIHREEYYYHIELLILSLKRGEKIRVPDLNDQYMETNCLNLELLYNSFKTSFHIITIDLDVLMSLSDYNDQAYKLFMVPINSNINSRIIDSDSEVLAFDTNHNYNLICVMYKLAETLQKELKCTDYPMNYILISLLYLIEEILMNNEPLIKLLNISHNDRGVLIIKALYSFIEINFLHFGIDYTNFNFNPENNRENNIFISNVSRNIITYIMLRNFDSNILKVINKILVVHLLEFKEKGQLNPRAMYDLNQLNADREYKWKKLHKIIIGRNK